MRAVRVLYLYLYLYSNKLSRGRAPVEAPHALARALAAVRASGRGGGRAGFRFLRRPTISLIRVVNEMNANDGAGCDEQQDQAYSYRVGRKDRRPERRAERGGANQEGGAGGNAPHTPSGPGRSPDPKRLDVTATPGSPPAHRGSSGWPRSSLCGLRLRGGPGTLTIWRRREPRTRRGEEGGAQVGSREQTAV